MKNILAIGLVAILALSSCIGTDIVEELEVPEEVTISTAIDSLAVGGTFQFAADHFDDFGNRTNENVSWGSSDETIISIDDNGLATAQSEGDVFVRAWVGSVIDSVRVNSGETTSMMTLARSGNMQGLASYRISGRFVLSDTGTTLDLSFGDDFTSSNGPGLYIYLSNSPNSVTGGVEVARLASTRGAQSYIISKDDAQLNTYSHVVVYCKPFGVAFGFGAFEN